MAAVNPYLTFNGTCEEAFNFYKSVFGTEFLSISRFTDMPRPVSEEEKNRIMYVALPIGPTVLMGSDRSAQMGPGTNGNNFSVAINGDSEEETHRIFDGLSAGGNISMPLGKAPWGALFGMFEDKFGIQWMINYDEPQKG
ncbi:VOC family protein [Chitinophaga sp. 30R24]|uniref:VOC family protein n=1 Tax=Chitinophaga sp. 30R24 TaxID=3248838 RepID=UPI003B8EB36E